MSLRYSIGIAQAVDRTHRCHDHDVVPLHQARCRPEPQALEIRVDRSVLLDVNVGLGDVRLGLVVVVVGDEVLHRVAGQELAEFTIQLRRQGLVMREDQRRDGRSSR
jgi:hypothetical protein